MKNFIILVIFSIFSTPAVAQLGCVKYAKDSVDRTSTRQMSCQILSMRLDQVQRKYRVKCGRNVGFISNFAVVIDQYGIQTMDSIACKELDINSVVSIANFSTLYSDPGSLTDAGNMSEEYNHHSGTYVSRVDGSDMSEATKKMFDQAECMRIFIETKKLYEMSVEQLRNSWASLKLPPNPKQLDEVGHLLAAQATYCALNKELETLNTHSGEFVDHAPDEGVIKSWPVSLQNAFIQMKDICYSI